MYYELLWFDLPREQSPTVLAWNETNGYGLLEVPERSKYGWMGGGPQGDQMLLRLVFRAYAFLGRMISPLVFYRRFTFHL